MLTDAFSDFSLLVNEPDADLPSLLANFEADLSSYSGKDFGYIPQVFPLLRKAARWYVAGKFSWRALKAVSMRLDLCYVGLEETEEALVDDLRAYIRTKPTIDLRTKVGRIGRCRQATRKVVKHKAASTEAPRLPISPAAKTAVTPTGVLLSLVR